MCTLQCIFQNKPIANHIKFEARRDDIYEKKGTKKSLHIKPELVRVHISHLYSAGLDPAQENSVKSNKIKINQGALTQRWKIVPTFNASVQARWMADVIHANMSNCSRAHLRSGPFDFVWNPFCIHYYLANFTLWVWGLHDRIVLVNPLLFTEYGGKCDISLL